MPMHYREYTKAQTTVHRTGSAAAAENKLAKINISPDLWPQNSPNQNPVDY